MTANESEVKDLKDQKITPVSMEDWRARVKARLLHGEPNQKALVCEGEAGCGKSEITHQICNELGLPPVVCPGIGAQQMEEFLAMVKIIETTDGGAKIVQAVHENLIPTQRLVESGVYTKTINGQKKTIIPWIIDEIWTGSMGQMNQIRGFLTFRQSGSVRIPNETFIIGTTNPEDIAYSSRRTVDAAVMDRVETIRVYLPFEMHQQYLAKLEREGRYPVVCRMFLRMDEQRDLWKLASPRFWHMCFGGTWQELSANSMPEDQRIRLFEQALSDHFQQIALRNKQRRSQDVLPMTPQALIGRFQTYIAHGEDPRYYPISANKVLEAGESKALTKSQLELFDYWKENSMQSFIGITAQDMTSVICTLEDCTKAQAKHIVNLLDVAGSGSSVQFFRELFATCKEKPIYQTIYTQIKDSKTYEAIAEATRQQDKMIDQLKMEKIKNRKAAPAPVAAASSTDEGDDS
jgi:hypothetical protein